MAVALLSLIDLVGKEGLPLEQLQSMVAWEGSPPEGETDRAGRLLGIRRTIQMKPTSSEIGIARTWDEIPGVAVVNNGCGVWEEAVSAALLGQDR